MIYGLTFALIAGLLVAVSIKWELDRRISLFWAVAMGLVASLIVALLSGARTPYPLSLRIFIAGTVVGALTSAAILIRFFRDPQRKPPDESGVIVAPADGVIRYVTEVRGGELPFAFKKGRLIPLSEFVGTGALPEECHQIGIGMSMLDVHINRSPIRGTLTFLRHIPGRFLSLKRSDSIAINERVAGVVEDGAVKIGLVLIASRLVRRICVDVAQGQDLEIGQRIGMIRFGSQTDILIPKAVSPIIKVHKGDKVKAGVTIIATLK